MGCPSCHETGYEVTSNADVVARVKRYVCGNQDCPRDKGTDWTEAESEPELLKLEAQAKARRELERTIEALEQFGRAAAAAAQGIERAMVEFKEAFARLAQKR